MFASLLIVLSRTGGWRISGAQLLKSYRRMAVDMTIK